MAQHSMRILAVANQKGGVGKTTTAINLGTALAAAGERVLIVDTDPQGNASTGLGIASSERSLTTFDVLTGEADLSRAAIPTKVQGLAIVPANSDLVGLDQAIGQQPDRPFKLRDALTKLAADQRQAGAAPGFSYVLIDCPPSLSLLTLNAMAAAHAVLVPVQCEFYALEGISQIKETIEQIRGSLNPGLEIQGVVLTMHDNRVTLAKEVEQNVRQFFGTKVYKTVIPRNTRIAEAPSHGTPVLIYDKGCAGSVAYRQLAAELIERERGLAAA